MPIYRAPVRDVLFLIDALLDLPAHATLPGFAEATPETIAAIVTEAARLAEQVLQPLNRVGDLEGCTRAADGAVTTPKGFRDAYRRYAEGGWVGLSADPAYGGQGLPALLGAVISEFASSANMALAMYPGLTAGAIAALSAHGSETQKATYLPPMIAGTWTGTMNLTEPQCGTDLGLIRTRATPEPNGSYRITGTKIFISAGEHDLADNIVHLVLARIDGAPEGTRGISLFVVPKRLVGADGSLGARNAVSCGVLEHKMGIHGNATCVMNYDGAAGWLVGEADKGLRAMFTMMNEARLGVGIQGLALSEVAAQNAVSYARERLQGRSLTGAKAPGLPADPLIVHADIRRALMTMRAVNEAGRALVLWTALQGDIAHRSTDPGAAAAADDVMGLLTPVIKGVLTDRGFDTTVAAQQIFGGHGYIAGAGMEQFVRDARIAMIYEGANGIQALDLVGRKLSAHGGRAVMAFFGAVAATITSAKDKPALAPLAVRLKAGADDLNKATMWFMANANADPDQAGAGATDYMHLFGLVALGWMWLRIAGVAEARLAAGAGDDTAFLEAKLVTARFFMERMLPETGLRLARITAGAGSTMALPAEAF